jgi:plasmid maintenance system antidote protein VapI
LSYSLSELLRRSIRESGRSVEEIVGDAGVSPIVIARFVSGERDIHMATADRLARSLGLEVTAD